jgi:hypothetical protein
MWSPGQDLNLGPPENEAAFIIKAIAVMMEAVSTFETSVSFYDTTRGNIPEDSPICVVHTSVTDNLTLSLS